MSTPTQSGTTSSNSKLVTAALVITGSSGVGVFLCMPAIASALVEVWGFDNQQVGQFSFIQLAFVSLGCLAGMFLGNRYSIRTLCAFSLGVLLAMELLSPHVGDNYSWFLVVRGISGIAGGATIAFATGALAQLPGAERNFGVFLFTQICYSMLGILLMPKLVAAIGIAGVFYLLAAIAALVLIFLVRYIPSVPVVALGNVAAEQEADKPRNSSAAWVYSCIILVAILVFFIGIGAFWTFVKIIGEESGLAADATGLALFLAGIGGMLGSLVPIFLKTRFGNIAPVLAAFLILLVSIYLVANQSSIVAFTVAASLFVFGWYIYHPYQIGVLAAIDRDGRPAMASAALTGFGLGLGPALVPLAGGEGFYGVYLVSTVSFIVCVAILIGAAVFSRSLRQSS